MLSSSESAADPLPDEEAALQIVLGYLNFSSGKPDAKFQQQLNRLHGWLTPGEGGPPLMRRLTERLQELSATSPAFADCAQATAVLDLTFGHVLPAYQAHHADLLFHLQPADFLHPLFVARVVEAVLSQGPPWHETSRIVAGGLSQLNDYVGYRPVAVLENGRLTQPYDHERFRPVPLYIMGVGAGAGRHRRLVESAIAILAMIPRETARAAWFSLNRLEELALDVRAHDQSHPVFKRTNYIFGEWDPHCINSKGRYTRFVVRSIILQGLADWMDSHSDRAESDRLFEAGAVLAGTILMASAVSGDGPDAHDSTVTLSRLLPLVSRLRDGFYAWLLESVSGPHGERLRREGKAAQQPFGEIRQHLNLRLAHFTSLQSQRACLAELYARMGYDEEARSQAAVIPSNSVRFETEIQRRVSTANLEITRDDLRAAESRAAEAQELLYRGIDCGALVDPWNILGFQGQFPLSSSRDDSIGDTRVDKLLAIMEQLFALYTRLVCEAAAAGDEPISAVATTGFRRLADFWDRFATTTVQDLQPVHGGRSFDSAVQVARALREWSQAGEAAGDIAFWKKHVAAFESANAFAVLIDVLLHKRDVAAAMNLLVQWASRPDALVAEVGRNAFFSRVRQWLKMVSVDDWQIVRKFFDYLEANAGDWCTAPTIAGDDLFPALDDDERDAGELDDDFDPFDGGLSDWTDEDEPTASPFENVKYRDSADDGHQGDMVDPAQSDAPSQFEQVVRPLDARIKFLTELPLLWRSIAVHWATIDSASSAASAPERIEAMARWCNRCYELQRELSRLLAQVAKYEPQSPEGDPDSLIDYDRELQVQFNLVNAIIWAQLNCQEACRLLRCVLPRDAVAADPHPWERTATALFRLMMKNDIAEVRRRLPALQRELLKQPLLYTPLDCGGDHREALAVRQLQMLLRGLMVELPRQGLVRETWHLVRTAYQMERSTRVEGVTITEFDRLLQAALQSTLESIVHSSAHWPADKCTDDRLVELLGMVVELYLRLWLKHSATMRLSCVELLNDAQTWRRVKAFIIEYGGELFTARVLSHGNLRGIVHHGADWYLDYLEHSTDPLHPLKLLADLDVSIPRNEAVFLLETVFESVVDKFERFMEYNTTTTHSDYGEKLYCFLDFLRLEAAYERQAWNLVPFHIAHEVLARHGREQAAVAWRNHLERKTAPLARTHLQKLHKLEKQHGLRLPGVSDRINECYTKSLALDLMLARVRPAMLDALRQEPSESFDLLKVEAEQYLTSTSGGIIDVHPWLQSLTSEIVRWNDRAENAADEDEPLGPVLVDRLSPDFLLEQLKIWENPLTEIE